MVDVKFITNVNSGINPDQNGNLEITGQLLAPNGSGGTRTIIGNNGQINLSSSDLTDGNSLATKVNNATEGDIAKLDSNGNIIDSGVLIGNESIGESGTTITGAISALQTKLSNSMYVDSTGAHLAFGSGYILNVSTTGAITVDVPPPPSPSDTRFTLSDGTVETYSITGALDQQWMIDNGYYDGENQVWLKTITQAVIGDTVTSIGNYAFRSCSDLTSVMIPDSVTSIGNHSFRSCSSLTGMTIPDSVTSIGHYAFEGCSSLTTVTIPNGVTSIEGNTFYYCRSLTTITIPDSVTSIGNNAFTDCVSLTSVTITSNGGDAASVKQKMIAAGVDENVTWIMPEPVIDPTKTRFTLQDGTVETHSITGTLDYSWMENNGYMSWNEDPGGWVWNKQIVQADIGNTVNTLGFDTFNRCSSLTNITIPDSVTSIESQAFIDCNHLTEITIPTGVTSIPEWTFNGCSSLTNITIPDSVTNIGEQAFDGCSISTVTITANGGNAATVKQMMIDNGVPSSGVTWNMPEPASHPETRVKYTEASGITPREQTFNIEGELGYSSIPNSFSTEEIDIGNTVTSIGEGAFSGSPTSLMSVTIPSSVTSIEYNAFMGCSGLTSVTFLGKTLAQVQAMDDYPWEIEDTSIINVA